MKILLSVYACEPNRGSEPGVGWNMAVEIAKHHQVWAFTSNTHRKAIETELAVKPVPNLNFIYLDPFGWVYDWSMEGKQIQWDIHIHYYLWQIQAYFIAKALHREIGFDLVHHITYVKYSSPSFLSLLSVPFVWGPVGGAESAPLPFWKDFSFRGKVYENFRNLARRLGELDPFVRLTARRSILAWATTEDTANRIKQIGASNVQVLSQVGLLPEEIEFLANYPLSARTPIRFISMGRLLHWKGFHFGLRAFASATLPHAEYWIVGDGPERHRLEQLAQELGIASQVKFWGKLSRHEGFSKLEKCHVLVHPSLHDSGGMVCLEAMAAGRPVICLDLGGPAVQVTEENGFKVPAHNTKQAIQDLSKAIELLANNPELRERIGQTNKKIVKQKYSWESKGYYLAKLYDKIISAQNIK